MRHIIYGRSGMPVANKNESCERVAFGSGLVANQGNPRHWDEMLWRQFMKTVREAIAANLKFLREQKGWTQPQAAKYYGVNVIQVAKYESGKNAPEVERLARIAKLYGVSVDSIMGLKKMIVTSEE
jgi:DNA-binding XRE family transcriptional regulator